MDKVEYAVDAQSTFPATTPARSWSRSTTAAQLGNRVAVNRGNPDRPLSNAEIEAKYFENCALTLDEARGAADPRRGA